MKNQDQANNLNNLNNPNVANDPQSQVEFDDLPISGEQEERVKGGPRLQWELHYAYASPLEDGKKKIDISTPS